MRLLVSGASEEKEQHEEEAENDKTRSVFVVYRRGKRQRHGLGRGKYGEAEKRQKLGWMGRDVAGGWSRGGRGAGARGA